MDKIIIKNMKIYGYHGVLPREQKEGQLFCIDVEMYTDLGKAGDSDSLEDTVDYSEVYNLVRDIVQSNKFQLIEKLAKTIGKAILQKYNRVDSVKICARKPEAPIEGEFGWVGVEVHLHRERV
ncbi:MAG: dihydroneopterin aldolase [Firmicutes bacterium]|nr:dihydroneopterin aldolase [Bacillota bacterium]